MIEVRERTIPGDRTVYWVIDDTEREAWQNLSNGRKNISRKDMKMLRKLGVKFQIVSEDD